jgi:Zn-finger domain-containing protein
VTTRLEGTSAIPYVMAELEFIKKERGRSEMAAMSSARGEGAVIDRRARTVRLRHEARGFAYQIEGDEEKDVLDVFRVDALTDARTLYGEIRRVAGRWRGTKGASPAITDALNLVARAWTSAPLLKPRE